MKTKKVTKYIYKGFGFPIELDHVQMIMLQGKWQPKIDVRKIADLTLQKLATQTERLTGNHVKFIRDYFSMSLREFAKEVVNESHTAISKWEKTGNKVTNMDINIEKIIRLFIVEKTYSPKHEEIFFEKYLGLKKIISTNKNPSQIQINYCG